MIAERLKVEFLGIQRQVRSSGVRFIFCVNASEFPAASWRVGH